MADNSILCHGCMSQFSHSGYTFHICQTTNPLCQRIYDAQMAYIPESDPPGPDSPQGTGQLEFHHPLAEASSPLENFFENMAQLGQMNKIQKFWIQVMAQIYSDSQNCSN